MVSFHIMSVFVAPTDPFAIVYVRSWRSVRMGTRKRGWSRSYWEPADMLFEVECFESDEFRVDGEVLDLRAMTIHGSRMLVLAWR
jgi:hypothetical protein